MYAKLYLIIYILFLINKKKKQQHNKLNKLLVI